MMRGVRTAGGMVKEEGFIRCDNMRVQDKLDGMVDQIFVQVIALFDCLGLGYGMVIVG